jgi:hypothetical protein
MPSRLHSGRLDPVVDGQQHWICSPATGRLGLVMHYFGSKQELYRRVIDAAPVPEISGTPTEAAEQILASLADRLASAASTGIARYEAQIARAIPAGDADLRAAHHQTAASVHVFAGGPPRAQRAF